MSGIQRTPSQVPSPSRAPEQFYAAVEAGDFQAAMAALAALEPNQVKALKMDRQLLARIPERFDLLDTVSILDFFGRGTVDPLVAYGGLSQGMEAAWADEPAEQDELDEAEDLEEQSAILDEADLRSDAGSGLADELEAQRVPVLDQLDLAGVLDGNPDWEVFFGIFTRLSSADRQLALVELLERGLWEAFLEELVPESAELLQRMLEQDREAAEPSELPALQGSGDGARRGRAALERLRPLAEGPGGGRLTPRLLELLVLGVARPRLPGNPRASRGYLGVAQAERAARALLALGDMAYLRFLLLLLLASPRDRGAQSAVLLAALAARLPELDEATGDEGVIEDLEAFARELRGLDPEGLARATTVLQLRGTGDPGLQHRYQANCNTTTALVLRAEADPTEALRIHLERQRSMQQHCGHVAEETAESLERRGGGRPVARDASRTLARAMAALRAGMGTLPAASLLLVRDYLAGRKVPADRLEEALAALRELSGEPCVLRRRVLRLARQQDAGTLEPGLEPEALLDLLNEESGLPEITGRSFELHWEEELWQAYNREAWEGRVEDRSLPRPLPADWVAAIRRLLGRAEQRLEEGWAVPIQVYWEGIGGRTMSFHDVSRRGGERAFLLHDPCLGSTSWMSERQILEGHWPAFSRRGLLCAVLA